MTALKPNVHKTALWLHLHNGKLTHHTTASQTSSNGTTLHWKVKYLRHHHLTKANALNKWHYTVHSSSVHTIYTILWFQNTFLLTLFCTEYNNNKVTNMVLQFIRSKTVKITHVWDISVGPMRSVTGTVYKHVCARTHTHTHTQAHAHTHSSSFSTDCSYPLFFLPILHTE